MKNFNPIFGIGIALIFIVIGFYLISIGDQLSVIIGYANIIFWGILILFALFKLITKDKSK